MKQNIKSLILVLALIAGLFVGANNADASNYGQEVKGVTTEEKVIVHKTVDTGIEDHFDVIGLGFLGASALFYSISKKIRASSLNA